MMYRGRWTPGTLGLAGLAGGLLALAFPGTGDQGWLAFGALVPLLVAIDGVPWREARLLGGVAGLAFWLTTVPWLAGTIVRYGGLSWGVANLILLGLAAYLALYWAAFAASLARLPRCSGVLYVLLAASLWVALEWLRGVLFTGFPWNLLGYSQYQNHLLSQIAAVTGVYGVSFVVMAVNAALAGALVRGPSWRARLAPLGLAGLILLAALGYGELRSPAEAEISRVAVAVIQGNIDQGVKWDPTWQDKTVGIYSDLTRRAAQGQPKVIVWPETAVPFLFADDPRRAAVEGLARDAGAFLLVGAPDRRAGEVRNSAFLIGPGGQLLGRYDKRHLVPFGEYVPLKPLLSFVNVLAGGAIGEFAPGREATVFATPIARFAVVICYEVIFPAEVREFFRAGADVLVNLTDDAWFGRSAAPAQHLAMAVFRAIEIWAYLLRAANTGISAIVAPDGRILQATGLFTPAIVVGGIQPRGEGNLYTRYGDVFAWGTMGIALAAVLAPLAIDLTGEVGDASLRRPFKTRNQVSRLFGGKRGDV